MDIITTNRLEELKTIARGGSDRQRADYVLAQKKHDEMVQLFFKDEGIDFLERPSEGALNEFKTAYEADPEDLLAKARYMMIKAQYDASQRETINQKYHDFRLQRQEVRDIAADPEAKVTPAILEQARQVAAQNPTTENRAAYALIKRRLENSGA
jgi:hypothetical protein